MEYVRIINFTVIGSNLVCYRYILFGVENGMSTLAEAEWGAGKWYGFCNVCS